MKSNVYLACGTDDWYFLMKVGKANNIKLREKQIYMSIKVSVPTMTVEDAFILETRMRKLAVSLGATRYPRTYDSFFYNESIYRVIEKELGVLSASENIDDEIAFYQQSYQRILAKDMQKEMTKFFDAKYPSIERAGQ